MRETERRDRGRWREIVDVQIYPERVICVR